MIELAMRVLRGLGINALTVHVNSLGSAGTRERYRAALLEHFTPLAAELSEDSRRRLEKNPLRILDSKDPKDRAAAAAAPSILEVLDDADREHFAAGRAALDALHIEHIVDPKLVRGLDYYTRTLFEIKAEAADLGAQSTVCGGGRYDEMVEGLGGPKTPAIGVAMGLERILVAMGADGAATRPASVYVAAMGRPAIAAALEIASGLRSGGIPCEVDARDAKLKSMLKRADASGAAYGLIIGEDERSRGAFTVKDLAARAQWEVARAEVVPFLAGRAGPAASEAPR